MTTVIVPTNGEGLGPAGLLTDAPINAGTIIPSAGVPRILQVVSDDLGMPQAANRFLETGNLQVLAAEIQVRPSAVINPNQTNPYGNLSALNAAGLVLKGVGAGCDTCWLGPDPKDLDLPDDFDFDSIAPEDYWYFIVTAILTTTLYEVIGEPNATRLFFYFITSPSPGMPNPIVRLTREGKLTELYSLAGQVGVRGGPARQTFYQTIGYDTANFTQLPFEEFYAQVRSTQVGVAKRCLRRVYCRYMDLTDHKYEIDPVLVAALAWQIERSTVDCGVAVDLTVDAISDQIQADGFDFYDIPPFRRDLTALVNRYHRPNMSSGGPLVSNLDSMMGMGSMATPQTVPTVPIAPVSKPTTSKAVMTKPTTSKPTVSKPRCKTIAVDDDDTIRFRRQGWVPKGPGSNDIYFRYGERSILVVVPNINAGPQQQDAFEAEVQKVIQKYADAEYRINLVEEFVGTGKMSMYGDMMEHCSGEISQWFADAGLVNVDMSMTANRQRVRCVLVSILIRRNREWVDVPSFDANGIPLSFSSGAVTDQTIHKICYRIFSDIIIRMVLSRLSLAQMAVVVNRLGIPTTKHGSGSCGCNHGANAMTRTGGCGCNHGTSGINMTSEANRPNGPNGPNGPTGPIDPDLVHQVFSSLITDEPKFVGNLAIAVLNSQPEGSAQVCESRLVREVDRTVCMDQNVVRRLIMRVANFCRGAVQLCCTTQPSMVL
jgi:hypothetical protein